MVRVRVRVRAGVRVRVRVRASDREHGALLGALEHAGAVLVEHGADIRARANNG